MKQFMYNPSNYKFQLILLIGFLTLSCNVVRNNTGSAKSIAQQNTMSKKDSSKKEDQLKPYSSIVTKKAETQRGLLTVHKIGNKYYFELPDSVLNTDLLLVNRLARTSWDIRKQMEGYAGDEIGQSVIRFEKTPDHRIFIRVISRRGPYNADDSSASMYRVLERNNVPEIAAAFKINAFTPDSSASVFDVTDYITADNGLFGFKYAGIKKNFGLKDFQRDRSFVNYVKSFPTNVEINSTKTYNKGDGAATLELNTSLVMLPKDPMQPRFYDPRVGFINFDKNDFSSHPHGIEKTNLITRWRLEPRPEDREAYFKGELVEPVKPIVFYIDPATPEKWIPYLIKGVNDWQKAFEQAGFKNAIIGKRAPTPEQDPSWSLLDARHSAIVYIPSETMNASGPSISDPRTGEIIESHINWFHNVMELLHGWYFVQAGAVDPEARRMEYSDQLMGELIRFVAAHEVGHTLGLQHNWTASSTVPVENLRNRDWLRKHGHTPSIMDYARFNYVAQPEDSLTRDELFPHIGEYDKWAIEWGYKILPDVDNAKDEVPLLNKTVIKRLKENERLRFGPQDWAGDPRTQTEDLGDDALKASAYGIKNLKRIVPNLQQWTRTANSDYDNLSQMYDWVIRQFDLYMNHVAGNIGGLYYTPKTVEQPGYVYERMSAQKQKDAVRFLDQQLFTTPTWLLEPTMSNLILKNPVSVIERSQTKILERLISSKLITMTRAELYTKDAYNDVELLGDLRKIILRDVKAHGTIDIFRRNLQRIYVERLIHMVAPSSDSPKSLEEIGNMFVRESGAISVIKGELREIYKLLNATIPYTDDKATRYHLQDLSDRIRNALSLDPASTKK